jgi:hypothetical protein
MGGAGGSTATGGADGSGGSLGSGGFTSDGSSGTGGDAGGSVDSGVIDGGDPHPCPAGGYTGTLSGPYRSRLGNSQFAARVELTIGADGKASGKIAGTSNTTGKASMVGRLDCMSGKLELDIVNGSYSDALGTVRYAGNMSASYQASTQSFPDGRWKITEPSSNYGGEGSWSATLTTQP